MHIDKVAWLLIRDRRVLGARSHGKDAFFFPGGKRDPGESDAECLARELHEEVSVALRPDTITLLGKYHAQAHGKPEGVMVYMTCYAGEFDGELAPAAEIAELAWLTSADKERTSEVAKLIFDDLVRRDLID